MDKTLCKTCGGELPNENLLGAHYFWSDCVKQLRSTITQQADLIRRLKETLNDYDRVSNDLARFAYHAVSCVKRSPHVACSDVCDCGYIKAAREHAALHTALISELEKREHVQD